MKLHLPEKEISDWSRCDAGAVGYVRYIHVYSGDRVIVSGQRTVTEVPGLLVVSDYPIGFPSGFGITLFNLLKDYDHNRLYCAHPRHLLPDAHMQHGMCIQYDAPTRPQWLSPLMCRAYAPVLKWKQHAAARRLVCKLEKLIYSQGITHLLAIPVSPWILRAAMILKKRIANIRLVIFVMDDWEGHHRTHSLPYLRRRRVLLNEVVQTAYARFAVSDEMAAAYRREFECDWSVARNPCTLPLANNCRHDRADNADTGIALLAGDVNDFRFDAVLAFAHGLSRHNLFHGTDLQLHIMGDVSATRLPELESLDSVRLLGRRPQAECIQRMETAELLYLPLAFNQRNLRISMYSLPTKLPEYLSTGRPVLIHAPAGSAAVELARRHEIGPCITSNDPVTIDRFISRWVACEPGLFSSPECGFRAIEQEFSEQAIRNRFLQAFSC